MRSLKIFSLIGLAMLLISANVVAEVYDDEGTVITEEEIEAEMGSVYRKGCAIGGGCLLAFPSLIGAGIVNEFIIQPPERYDGAVIIPLAIVFEIGGTTASYYIGKHFDRRRAINRIAQQKGWAEKNPALDDDGYLITEAEIEAEMGSAGRTGCLFFGGLFSLGASFLGSCVLAESIGDDEVFLIGTIAGTILGGKLSYEAGESIDRRAAIKKIKERRRKQKQGLLNFDGGRFFAQPTLQMKSNQFHHLRSENDIVILFMTVGF